MRVAFDIGGTFTDVIILADDGSVGAHKVLTLMESLGHQIADLVAATGEGPVEHFSHGTTIAANMVIEGTTATTALLTTRGFRDAISIRAQRRPNLYDPTWQRLPAAIPRALTREIGGRVRASGDIEQELDPDEVKTVVADLLNGGVEAVAVCLINSYVNPEQERAAGAAVAELAPDLPVCLSVDLNPEINEYERMSTTAINASLVPGVREYIDQLEAGLTGLTDRLLIMRSNGGIMTGAMARQYPVYMIESGPAAGALAAASLASESGLTRALSFDMGGTTAKACLIEGGLPLEKPGGEIGPGITSATRLFGGGGYAIRVPSLDIVEVGAGGGSIAWIDAGGALRVGPRSAGAEPGPACYGRGGALPTVTDANVVLGYMNPDAIAGSSLEIDAEAARRSVQDVIAAPLGLDLASAAYGICQVANSTMMRALRAVSTERGRDPREFSLVAFGGAGAMHAAALADFLGVREICVPLFSGLFSSVGLLFADFRNDYVRTVASAVDDLDEGAVRRTLEEMEATAWKEMTEQGLAAAEVSLERHADLRYLGQVAELAVAIAPTEERGQLLARLPDLFAKAHEEAFGYSADAPVELVNLRLRAMAKRPGTGFVELAERIADGTVALPARSRAAYFGPNHGEQVVRVIDRWGIEGVEAGPVIVEEPDTTVVVPPGWTIQRDERATVVLRKGS